MAGKQVPDIRMVERTHSGKDGLVERIDIQIELPPDFPEKYRESVIRAAELCTVKKHLEHPPVIAVTTEVVTGELAPAR